MESPAVNPDFSLVGGGRVAPVSTAPRFVASHVAVHEIASHVSSHDCSRQLRVLSGFGFARFVVPVREKQRTGFMLCAWIWDRLKSVLVLLAWLRVMSAAMMETAEAAFTMGWGTGLAASVRVGFSTQGMSFACAGHCAAVSERYPCVRDECLR